MRTANFKYALEGDQEAEKTVVMQGPLSEVYTKALAIAYAKQDPINQENLPPAKTETVDVISTESQANDALMAQAMAKAITGEQGIAVSNTTASNLIYGVNKSGLQQDFVNVVDAMQQNKDSNLVVVIDAMNEPGEPIQDKMIDTNEPIENPEEEQLMRAVESLAMAYHVKVARSLPEALKLL